MSHWTITGIPILAALALGLPATGHSAEVRIAQRSGPKARIVVASTDPLMRRTGEWCRDFLAMRGYAVDPRLASTPSKGTGPEWVLEISNACPAKADGYSLTVEDAGRPRVHIVGRNVHGVRSGVARLVALMKEQDGCLTVHDTREKRSPFFPIRRIMICPTGRICDGVEGTKYNGLPESSAIWSDTLFTKWSDERLKQYAEQLWLMGFNSVETCEIRGYRGMFTDEQLKNEITPKLRVFMQTVRDNGMEVSQFIWGQSLFKEGDNLCWNSPEERKQMEAEYRRLAQTYGDLVDHIVVHVGDPGGCNRNGCDAYKTTQEIATCILREYRKANPEVTVTLSTWANAGFWNGRKGDKFLDESCSPEEIGIALHRWYDPKQAKLIRDSGRQCDIWGWYLSDFELYLDPALLMRRLDGMFSALPDQASEDVRAISTEICFHGWPHIINAYVSAQKMWDPKRDLREIEREFCAGTFGDRSAENMVSLYQACEAYVHPGRYYGFISPKECPPVVFGTSEYNRQCRRALAAGKAVVLDSERPWRLTSATDPKAMHDYLMDNLALISVFSEAEERVTSAKESGASREALQAAVADAISEASQYKSDPDWPFLVQSLTELADGK